MVVSKKSLKNLKHFQKGKSGNPKGRPKSIIKQVNEELEKFGIEPVRKQDLDGINMRLLQLTMDQLKDITKAEDMPAYIRIQAKNLLSKEGAKTIETLLDRTVGKPVQNNINENKTIDIISEDELTD